MVGRIGNPSYAAAQHQYPVRLLVSDPSSFNPEPTATVRATVAVGSGLNEPDRLSRIGNKKSGKRWSLERNLQEFCPPSCPARRLPSIVAADSPLRR
jgi:hypothetical protein